MESLRRVAGFPDVAAALPDETTILNFRHLRLRVLAPAFQLSVGIAHTQPNWLAATCVGD
jgi:hypothetical protein